MYGCDRPINYRNTSTFPYRPHERITHFLMSIQPHKKEQMSKSFSEETAIPPQISIFYKTFIPKGYFAFILIFSTVLLPLQASASFMSSVGGFFGLGAQAADNSEETHNSQTIPLMESALTPDLKLSKNIVTVNIVDDQVLESNISLLGSSDVQDQYVSTRKIQTYVIQPGDTLDKISKEFGISKNTIVNSNDSITLSGKLTVGDVIVILPIEGLSYQVKKGDTVGGLAIKFNSSSKEILEYNDIDKPSDLRIGDTIVIPGGVKPKEAPKTTISKAKPKVEIHSPASKSDSTPSTSGYIWPFPEGAGRISQRIHDDNAVDIAAPKGTPIYAIKDGKVLVAKPTGYNGGFGLYVVIDFDTGGQALYGHMSKVASKAGQVVKQGDLIGYVGSTGRSTGNHVHLSLRGGLKNPYGFLKVNNTSKNFK